MLDVSKRRKKKFRLYILSDVRMLMPLISNLVANTTVSDGRYDDDMYKGTDSEVDRALGCPSKKSRFKSYRLWS